MSVPTLRVHVLAEDPIVRAGLGLLLRQEGVTVTEAGGALADVAVVDWRGGAVRGLDALGAPWLALVDEDHAAEDALREGARGVLLAGGEVRALVLALAAVASGLVVLEPAMVPSARPRPALGTDEGARVEPLTARELEVLQLLAEALPNKLIAHRLGISEHTVKFHVNAVLSKLGAGSRTEAVVRAARRGLVLL